MDLITLALAKKYTEKQINELNGEKIPSGETTVEARLDGQDAEMADYATQQGIVTSQLAENAINFADARELSGAYEGMNLTVRFAEEIAEYDGDPWAWIKARVNAENFEGLHIRDYIVVTCENPGEFVLRMEIVGINTYKGSGSPEIPAHIDWISRDCWPTTVQYNQVDFNNGIGMDKFIGDGETLEFQLTRREAGYPTLSSVTVGAATLTPETDYTYDGETGILTFVTEPANAAVIKAVWETPIAVPFMASKLYAYMNSLRMGVPNEAALDPFLVEVDYTDDGIYKWLPATLKAVISLKNVNLATRFTAGTLRTTTLADAWVNIGPLWIPDEREVYGAQMRATHISNGWYTRWYPAFFGGNRRKGAGNGGSRAAWWLFPAISGNSTYFCIVYSGGFANYNYASSSERVPVGFRIRKS